MDVGKMRRLHALFKSALDVDKCIYAKAALPSGKETPVTNWVVFYPTWTLGQREKSLVNAGNGIHPYDWYWRKPQSLFQLTSDIDIDSLSY
jgi:hypothetical protein